MTPVYTVGYQMVNGKPQLNDIWALFTNPVFVWGTPRSCSFAVQELPGYTTPQRWCPHAEDMRPSAQMAHAEQSAARRDLRRLSCSVEDAR